MGTPSDPKEVLGVVEFFHIGEILFALVTCVSGNYYFIKNVSPAGLAAMRKLGEKHGAFVSHRNFPDKASFELFAASHDYLKAYVIDWENLVK
jgi:hypothetical protein